MALYQQLDVSDNSFFYEFKEGKDTEQWLTFKRQTFE
jgi:hypothetical protein